jgi:phosphate transport system substrate-binding protein
MRKILQICFFVALMLQGCTDKQHPAGYKADLLGIGASFPHTLYDIVISNYRQDTGNKVIYNETNSGSGIRAFEDRIVDFIITDTFLSKEEITAKDILQIPASLGAIVLAFNLPDIQEINLDSKIISAIYRGKIKHWDDDAIAAINPEIKLPNLPVVPVSRLDISGTTHLFSCYLARTDDEWKEQIDAEKSLKLPQGITAKGNPAVAVTIKNLQGSIGYLNLEHAMALDLPVAAIQNACGRFVKADRHSFHNLACIEFPDGICPKFTGLEWECVYPIPSLSWIRVYKNQAYNCRSIEKYESLKSFLHYVINPETQKLAGRLTYTPLPANAIEKARKLIESMEYRKQ